MNDAPGYPIPVSPAQGRCFSFVVPAGWQVAEEGQFAVVLVRQDRCAITVMMGNAGIPMGYPPGQYAWDQLARLGYMNLAFTNERSARPALGLPQAVEYDVDYMVAGDHCHGVAKVSVAPSYDSSTMVMTWAATRAFEWGNHAGWLPRLAEEVRITSGAAFGASGIMQQNLQTSQAFGQQLQQHRDWSQDLQAGVQQERDAAQARQQFEWRQAVSGQDRYDNPYTHQPIDLPSTNAVYWVNRATGQIVGDPNPTFDPRSASDSSWEPLRRAPPPPG